MAFFAGWIITRNDTEDELAMESAYEIWRILIRYVAPPGTCLIFVFNIC